MLSTQPMGSRLDQLMNVVDITQVMSQETEVRREKATIQEDFEQETQIEESDGSEDFAQQPNKKIIPSEPIEEEESYDAEKNARAVVYGLQALDSMILVPIATIKTKKRAGGSKVIAAMRKAYEKKMAGEELNDNDKRLLAAFDKYKKDLEILSMEYIPNKQTTDELIRLATPWCEDKKIQFDSGTAFWLTYAGIKAEQITKLLMK